MSTLSKTNESTAEPQVPSAFEDDSAVKVFVPTKAQASSLCTEIAAMYEAALGKGGVKKKGHDPYPDSDLFSPEGVRNTLEAQERMIAVAQIKEGGKDVIVGAMVADKISPRHVEFNSMAVPVARRGRKLGSHIVRGLSEIFEQDKFTVNCTELVTHSLASQAAHFHNGFRAICGFGFCHYPNVFFKDHPESVLWVTRLQGTLVPEMRRFRAALGRQLGKNPVDVEQNLITSQASGWESLAGGRTDALSADGESLNLLAEVLKERTAYVPKQYHSLVQSILFQFEDVLDCKVESWVSPEIEANESAEAEIDEAKRVSLTVEYKEGFGHSYIIFKNGFRFDESELATAIKSVHQLEKRYIKVCIPANSPQAIKTAKYLIEHGFVFHSYLPLYGYDEQSLTCEAGSSSLVKAPEFYDILSLQWIKPSVVKANPIPGETDSVIKIYGYPENLAGPIVRMIAKELEAIETGGLSKRI